MEAQRLAVDIFQLVDDQFLKRHRTDGTGWDWGWADWQRDWMNATPNRHAYRCLPLTIVNQTGWWIKNPVGFTATWGGAMGAGDIVFQFDSPDESWPQVINSQFGEGIITWNTPFLIRTKPAGSRLLITGPANYFRRNAHPLTALIESDWMTMSFTMNYKIMTPDEPVRFEVGEPLFQAIPLMNNICADLEMAEVRYQKLVDDPAMHQAYAEWSTARTKFHESKAKSEVKPDQWQKDYFQGRDALGREAATDHMTKVKPPQVLLGSAPAADPRKPNLVVESSDRAEEIAGERRRPLARRRPEPISRNLGKLPGPVALTAADPIRPESPARNGGKMAACPVNFGQPVEQALPEPARSALSSPPDGSLVEPPRNPQGDTMNPSSPATRAASLNNGAASDLEREVATLRRDQPVVAPSGIDDNWRRWIAENLLLDSTPASMRDAMVAAGVDPLEADREIQAARESPYVRGAEHLRNRLQKRDWLLGTYRRINRLNAESDIIPRRHRLSRGQFLDEYYSTNRPVIITGMMDDWPALKKWNLDFFETNFGDRAIEVQFGRNSGENYEVEREKFLKTIKVAEFVAMIRSSGTTNDFYLTANNNSSNKSVLPELWQDIVQVPEYLTGGDPMNGFFWMGPSGTVTPFHHDLTNNFMAQVIGRKKIKIAPSWDMPLMRNDFHVFSQVDGRITPPQPTPPLDQPQIIECILNPGEILFLPIGCLHYVEGIEVSVTISFTNFVFPNDFSSFYTTYHQV